MLQEFEAAWDQVRRIDRVILDLAVQNTNLKAFRLSFGKGRETVEHFENALNAVAADREFRAVTATVAEWSRQNTNVTSLNISLDRKQKATALCEALRKQLHEAFSRQAFKATR